MNPFLNPIFASKVLKSYLFDVNRLSKFSNEKLEKYQNKQFRKMLDFAFTVPLYQDKYKRSGIKSSDIASLNEIFKLPFITKDYIKKYYPQGIVNKDTNTKKLRKISTSGTTGKELSIYVDNFQMIIGLFGYLRILKYHNINWRKDKLTIIGDFAPNTIESKFFLKGPHTSLSFIGKNIQWLNTNDDPKKLIKQIDNFKPDYLGGYAGMLGHLALLKEKGFGKNINPRCVGSTGSVLDKNLKKLIESSFNSKIFEVYAATETGPIAFQCKNGNYHVMSDLVYLEVLRDKKAVGPNVAGELAVTKLYGKGTPIIRYDAINDIVELSDKKCNCELSGQIIKRIYGRKDLSIVLPSGKIMLATSFSDIYSRILYELKTTKLIDTKIIQHDLKNLEIQIVIDEKQKDSGPSVNDIISILKSGFEEKVGPTVNVQIKQVKNLEKRAARVVSKVNKSEVEIKGYI